MLFQSVKDFGCIGDGVTDDTTKFQAAIDAAVYGIGTLYIDAGTFLISAPLLVSGSLTLRGMGSPKSTIRVPQTVPAGLDVTTALPVQFENFRMVGDQGVSNWSSLIMVTPSGAFNEFSCMRDISLVYGGIGMHMGNAAFWAIDRCDISQSSQIGVYVENRNAPDNGDSTICNSIISGPIGSTTMSCIYQASSGGLRINNNKIIGGAYGYLLSLTSGAVTSDLLVVGNSFELQTYDHLVGAPGTFSNVVIAANQMWSAKNAISLPNYANTVISGNAIV